MTLLPHLTRYSGSQNQPVSGSVIWLHGLGASGHDFEPLVPELGLNTNIRFIFPHAPERPVTINGGFVMPSWYDILSMGETRQVDLNQVEASVTQIKALLSQEHERGIPSEKIVLAGFSQGGAICLRTALHLKTRLAGIMALSTYIIEPDNIPKASESCNRQTPLLMHHGLMDPVVPLSLAQSSKAVLEKQGYTVQWQTWPMQHGVCPEQIVVIGRWLQQIFD